MYIHVEPRKGTLEWCEMDIEVSKRNNQIVLMFCNGNQILVGYVDVDVAGDVDSRKPPSGYFITFVGGVVSWKSRLQKCVALSTTKAGYIKISKGCKEITWMKKFMQS